MDGSEKKELILNYRSTQNQDGFFVIYPIIFADKK